MAEDRHDEKLGETRDAFGDAQGNQICLDGAGLSLAPGAGADFIVDGFPLPAIKSA